MSCSQGGITLFVKILTGVLLVISLNACAMLDPEPWPLLGDTADEAFYLDRQSVQRQANGDYRYRVKIHPYQPGKLHECDASKATLKTLDIEMDCRRGQMTILSKSVIDPNGKLLFRQPVYRPAATAIHPGSIHEVTYDYLCGDSDISARHQH
jgi:hypothetical protein